MFFVFVFVFLFFAYLFLGVGEGTTANSFLFRLCSAWSLAFRRHYLLCSATF